MNVRISVDGTYWIAGYGKYLGAHKRSPASFYVKIEVFVQKGVALGTSIAFMMAVVGLSLPEATMLKKAMTWKLIGVFFGTVAVSIILSGWLFNLFL